MPRIRPVDVDGEIRSAAPGERARRRPALNVQQFTEPMATEVRQLLYVGVQLGNLELDCLFLDADEAHRLVWRTLHEQLHFAVLVGGPERREGCRAYTRIVCRTMFAETFRPQLNEPVRDVAERIRVRHQHVYMPAQLRIGEELKHREGPSGILRQ